MFTPATDRLNSFRNNEGKHVSNDNSEDYDVKVGSNMKMDNEKRFSLADKLAKISEIDADDELDYKKNGKMDKNNGDDFEISYGPLKRLPRNFKGNMEKLWKSWQDEDENGSKADDKSVLVDYEPLLYYPKQNLATLSLSTTLGSTTDCTIDTDYEDLSLYEPESSNIIYVPVYNEDTLRYENIPFYNAGTSQGKKSVGNNYDLTAYHERPSYNYPSDFNTKILQSAKKNSLEYFSIDDEKDPVSALYIWCSRNKAIPVFTFTSEMEARGKSILGIIFICKITLLGSSSVGRGTSKKEAKKFAAEKMLHIINSGFKDDAVERINEGLSRLELSKRHFPRCSQGTVIIKAEEDDAKAVNNPISYLQEICLKQKWTVPDYRFGNFGTLFKCSVRLFINSEILLEHGFGHTKKEAKIDAARKVIDLCRKEGLISKFH